MPVHLARYEALAVALGAAKQPLDQVIMPHRNLAYQCAFCEDVNLLTDEFEQKTSG